MHGLGCSWRAVSGCVHVAGRVRGCVLPFQVGTYVNLAVGDYCKAVQFLTWTKVCYEFEII